jgi:hypothetical protein
MFINSWNHPPATLRLTVAAPTRWHGKGPPLVMNQSIRMARLSKFRQSCGGVCRHLPPHNLANWPTNQMRGVIQKLLAMGINMNENIVRARPKKSDKPRSHEQFSLTFYMRRSYKFQKSFLETIGTFLFFVPACFIIFFH